MGTIFMRKYFMPMSNLIMLALVGDMKLLFVLFVMLMLPFDVEFNASMDEDRDVVRFVDAAVLVDAKVDAVVAAVVLAMLVDETVEENELLFAPVLTN